MNIWRKLFTGDVERLETKLVKHENEISCLNERVDYWYKKSKWLTSERDKCLIDSANYFRNLLLVEENICELRVALNRQINYPRFKFTTKTDERKLNFEFVSGNPVTLVTIYERENLFSFGWSVCHKGDAFSIETGLRQAFEHAVEMSYGIGVEEKAQMADKFGAIITKVRNGNY